MDKRPRPHAAKEFRRRAAEARRIARAATNLAEKQDLLAVEQWWLSQARKAEAESEEPFQGQEKPRPGVAGARSR
jgi:hypothetical protein